MSFLAGHPKEPENLGTHHYKDNWVRSHAVLAVASTLNVKTMEVDINQSVVRFHQIAGGAAAKQVTESHKVFCMRHFNNFVSTGNVDDKPRSGRPVDIAEEDALRAAQILKDGYWQEVKVKGARGQKVDRLFYFTTFAEAVDRVAELRDLVEKYEYSDRKWLERMHAVDPDLVRVSLFSHHEFTVEELQRRMWFGKYMLDLLLRQPDLLHLLVFCDESTFVLHGRTKHSVQVYCSRTATRPSDVCYISDLALDPVKVHFFLAVTAHPLFQPEGVVVYDECTGTTDCDRKTNTVWDIGKSGTQEYMVSTCGIGFSISK